MEQYIPKSALMAEIEKKKKYAQTLGDNAINSSMQQFYDGMKQGCVDILSSIDTLDVKEMDLDFQRFAEEMDSVFALPSSETKNTEEEPLNWEYAIAKHFFELGFSINNPITAADRGTAEEIIINLKRVEQDYHIDLTKEMEWLRNKVKKGE